MSVALKKYTTVKNIIGYDKFDDSDQGSGLVHDLKSGKIDAVISDYIQAVSVVKNEPTLKIVGLPFTQEYYGLATKKGNNSLIDAVNQILRDMKRDGELKAVKDKWTQS